MSARRAGCTNHRPAAELWSRRRRGDPAHASRQRCAAPQGVRTRGSASRSIKSRPRRSPGCSSSRPARGGHVVTHTVLRCARHWAVLLDACPLVVARGRERQDSPEPPWSTLACDRLPRLGNAKPCGLHFHARRPRRGFDSCARSFGPNFPLKLCPMQLQGCGREGFLSSMTLQNPISILITFASLHPLTHWLGAEERIGRGGVHVLLRRFPPPPLFWAKCVLSLGGCASVGAHRCSKALEALPRCSGCRGSSGMDAAPPKGR